MKLVVVPTDKDIKEYKKIGAEAFIFGLKDFCSGYFLNVTISDIKKIKEENEDSEIFVAVNKNIFNDELPLLEEVLIELDKIKVAGVLFYDLAVLNIKLKNNLALDLVWNQTHMVTNYNTCNYYFEKGVKYGMLSSELTLEETNEIKENTKMRLFTMVMGYPIMSFTRRMLLSNYFISNNKERKKDIYNITNNGNSYIIREENSGNALFYGKPLNGSALLGQLKTDYLVLNEFNIAKDVFKEVLTLYKKIVDNPKDAKEYILRTKELIGDYTGFFFQKTIYKVKKNG